MGPVDLVLFSVKWWDKESAARSILPMVGPATGVISFQNGVQKDDVLREVLGAQAVVGGVDEVVQVARAEGVPMAVDYAAQRLAFCGGLPPAMTSSMHNDLERGGRLEVPWLSGDVVARGRRRIGPDTEWPGTWMQ